MTIAIFREQKHRIELIQKSAVVEGQKEEIVVLEQMCESLAVALHREQLKNIEATSAFVHLKDQLGKLVFLNQEFLTK